MRIALTRGCHQHLESDKDIWPVVNGLDGKGGDEVLIATALIRKPTIRLTIRYNHNGYKGYRDIETQAAGLWQQVLDDDVSAITAVVERARKLEIIS